MKLVGINHDTSNKTVNEFKFMIEFCDEFNEILNHIDKNGLCLNLLGMVLQINQ